MEDQVVVSHQRRILVAVFSGLVFSGKSFFRNWVMGLPEYKEASMVAMDDIRKRLWGDKSDTEITKSSHVFKNEATIFEIKSKLIVERPFAIFTEMVMLTREAHQRPFVEMIKSASFYLQSIEKEEAEQAGWSMPELSVEVDFRCIYFYCDLETVRRRINYRLREIETVGNITNASVFDFEGYLRGARQIEVPPIGYVPLYLNTSDESPVGLARQRTEVLSFLDGNMLSEGETEKRKIESVKILEQARKL